MSCLCSHPRPRSHAAQTVLVAEDEALVSMLIETELTDAGYSMIGPFADTRSALRWLHEDTPDLAILDHGLRDGPSTRLAEELRTRRVPFLVLSGSMPEMLPWVLRHAPRISKPSSLELLATALRDLHSTPDERWRTVRSITRGPTRGLTT